ncbi:hypothetical protein V6N11_052506 [Hibiscus sabdariffa]|uniref:RNase H type-1 domain-containing protein n=1 Tax=Hibiscus sabdariffa TaxID=183260 RepID=A0ABR2UAA8_9ROSI
MTTNSGEWDWSRLNSLLPRNILDQIAAIPPPHWGHREDLLIRGNKLLDECQYTFATNSRPQLSGTVTQRWSRPHHGWVKANVDASVISTDGSAALWGVFRDEDGTWLYGFARNIGCCSVLFAELWAIHDCLSKAWVAALGHSSPREGLSLTSPPVELALLVEEEKERSICERLVSQDWSNANTVAYFNMQNDPGG